MHISGGRVPHLVRVAALLAAGAIAALLLAGCALSGIVEVAVGSRHACALLSDGTVRCWGANDFGQLGDGSTVDRVHPVFVSGLSGVVALDAGQDHTCAVLTDGGVRCWGRNTYGAVGDGTTADRALPTPVSGVAGAVGVAAGGLHSCAVLVDGSATCWGRNLYGQLGDGAPVASRLTAVPVSGLAGVQSIALGSNHSCAQLGDGSMSCWGRNSFGQLGDGSYADRALPATVPGLADVAAAVVGHGHSCALLDDGALSCWGRNEFGQLGDGSVVGRPTPAVVPGLSGLVQAGSGDHHVCAIGGDGSIWCWGRNGSGQVGDGSNQNRSSPVPVAGPGDVGAVGGGTTFSCLARPTATTATCWGDNSYGQLGDGTTDAKLVPTGSVQSRPALPAPPVRDDQLGDRHSCQRNGAGEVACWGDNTFGQLGDGTTTSRSTPTVVPGLTNVLQVVAGEDHTCALVAVQAPLGDVYCWGRNDQGQVGDGTTTDRQVPTPVAGVQATQLAAGHRGGNVPASTCAVALDRTLQCWGAMAGSSPTSQPGATGVTKVAVSNAICVLIEDGTVRCRGSSGGFANVIGFGDAVDITAGSGYRTWNDLFYGGHFCVIHSTGSVSCWGSNDEGQLGDGTRASRSTPAEVPGLSNVVELVGGGQHTCARSGDGTARCWGWNAKGQQGRGTSPSLTTPGVVAGLGTVESIAAGGEHTCATRVGGSMWCWGRNAEGQLGDGTADPAHLGSIAGPAPPIGGVVELALGERFTCLRLAGGAVSCLGASGSHLASGDRVAPVQVPGVTSVTALAAGIGHVCAVENGSVLCWGKLWTPPGSITTPTPVAGVTGAVSVATSGAVWGGNVCARLADGSVWCWGSNTQGQVGQAGAPLTGGIAPGPVAGVAGAVDLAVAGGHSCAVEQAGAVRCWGSNSFGELGDGTTTNRATAVQAVGVSDAVSVTAGRMHTCVLDADGQVWCWGRNHYGQLGDGTRTTRLTPVAVPGMSDVVAVAAGWYFTCAVHADGSVSCWGLNDRGQLGDHTTTDRWSPVPVPGVAGVLDVAAGDHHACGLHAAGTASCWGENDRFQLGRVRLTPTPVLGW